MHISADTGRDVTHADRSQQNSPPRQSSARLSRKEKEIARGRRLLQTEVCFVHATEFEAEDAEVRLLPPGWEVGAAKPGRLKAPKDVPPHLTHLWQTALLKPEEERDLFRRMNFMKFLANVLRSRLNPDRPQVRVMDRIERLVADAEEIRNHIVQANLRLVVSIARKFVSNQNTFDELVSDGNVVLMKAVDRFDYSRGFRFSTYATHSVQREFYRNYRQDRRRQATEVSADPDVLVNSIEASETADRMIRDARQVASLKTLMNRHLRERDRRIVDLRFGLSANGGGRTLREVGAELGISKERVRQLQLKAMDRIREFAGDLPDADFSLSERFDD